MEKWKAIEGFEGLYDVSSLGKIRSHVRGKAKVLKTWPQPSGHINVVLKKNGKICRKKLARVLYAAFVSKIPEGYEIDHIDNNPKNNELSNLRLATRQQNCCNQKVQTRDKSSKYKGVRYSTDKNRIKRWAAYIKVKGIYKYLGRFHEEQEAALTYNEAAKKYFKDFANLNQV